MKISLALTLENLHDPRRYEKQIEKMLNKTKITKGVGALFEPIQEGISLFNFGFDRNSLAVALADSIRKETYKFTPLQLKEIYIPGKKKRLIYAMIPTDKIVLAVLADLLTDLFTPFFSENLYSYKRGVTGEIAVKKMSDFIRKHRLKHPKDPLYIYQTDIRSFSDSIETLEKSAVWKIFDHFFHLLGLNPTPFQRELITYAIRPDYYDLKGGLQSSIKGIPTGSPFSPLVYNILGYRLDQRLSFKNDNFYSRFSDDLVFISGNYKDTFEAEILINKELKALSLESSPTKTNKIYFTTAGKSPPDHIWKGKNQIQYLGYTVDARGVFSLSTRRQKKFLRQIFRKIENTALITKEEMVEIQGRLICQNINKSYLDETYKVSAANYFIKNCDDHATLRHLDYCIALKIASTLSKTKGPKAFKHIPYKKIRSTWNLKSLVSLRNSPSTTF